jgi:hypothetical protein
MQCRREPAKLEHGELFAHDKACVAEFLADPRDATESPSEGGALAPGRLSGVVAQERHTEPIREHNDYELPHFFVDEGKEEEVGDGDVDGGEECLGRPDDISPKAFGQLDYAKR